MEQPDLLENLAAPPAGYTVRAACMDDAAAVADLANAYMQALIGEDETTEEAMRHQWSALGFSVERSTRLAFAPDGQLAAYVDVIDTADPPVRIFSWTCVHPDHSASGIRAWLLEWALARSRESLSRVPDGVRAVMQHGIMGADTEGQAMLASLGLTLIRNFFEMRIDMEAPPPAPRWPQGISVRTMVPDQDVEAIAEALEVGFQDHWGAVPRPVEERVKRLQHSIESSPRFDPLRWFMAMDGEQVAGLALCSPCADHDSALGWVDQLTVLRPYRQQGIGLALLHHAFGDFYRRGTPRVGLGVDASSLTGATRLYEKAGMHVAHRFNAYEMELRSGTDLMRQTID